MLLPDRKTLTAALLAILALAGCSGSASSGSTGNAKTTLAAAKTTLDAASSVHFTLTSANVPAGGTRLIGGEGVIARPASFSGKLTVTLSGQQASIEIVSTGGTLYAKLPFASGFQVADPSVFGLSDPATLIDPKTGISRMFGELTGVTSKGEQRIGADVVTEIDGSIPGSTVKQLLTSADPAAPVAAQLFVTKSGNQLRKVTLTGPFFVSGTDSTFTLLLEGYNQKVVITPPPDQP